MKYNGKNSHAFNYIDSNYEFRFNVVTNFYEFRPKAKSYGFKKKKGKKNKPKETKWEKYDDRVKNSILLELMNESIDLGTEKMNIFIESPGFSPDYNPFSEYFKGLPKWDGETDYIKGLSKTVKTDKKKEFRKGLERFMVGTIDCLLRTDSVNDVCLVFQSGQGVGKTRWMRKLLPEQFRDEYLYEGSIDTRNKDHSIYLSQYWFIHLDELETLKSNEIGAIKSYITRQRISVRKAYGRYKTNFIRRASFLGSVNEDEFLNDLTGNRRWIVFPVNDIDYGHELDSDLFWAQAYALYKKGYRHWFNKKEVLEINNVNEEFRSVAQEEELVLRYFTFPNKGQKMSATEATQAIIANVPELANKINVQKVGKSLTKHSKSKGRTRGISKYIVNYNGIELTHADSSPAITQSENTKKITEVASDIDPDDLPF